MLLCDEPARAAANRVFFDVRGTAHARAMNNELRDDGGLENAAALPRHPELLFGERVWCPRQLLRAGSQTPSISIRTDSVVLEMASSE